MNKLVNQNYFRLNRPLLIVPLLILATIVIFLYAQDALDVDKYIAIQQDCFYFLNAKLSQFPRLIFNLTQLGDEIVILSLLSIFVLYAPKFWEALISASLVSCIFSCALKKIFAVPRPAAVFDHHNFVIIGKVLNGHNSLPSGHSITIFTVLTVLLFGFMPSKSNAKILWSILLIGIGLILVLTRVGVGAHYPLDVIIGATIGYISGLLGIFINEKYNIWNWVNYKKYYPIFILFFLICGITLINRIMHENLFVFYLALTSLIISLYKIIHVYVKK
jgi:membrane-associated phospholipid phosphatase